MIIPIRKIFTMLSSVQAEQCALIVHLKGKCEIKSGIKEVLQAMSRSLNAKGLNSKVENQF